MAAENFKVKKGLEVGTAITATSSGVNVTGVVTATQFVGDGSGLTGVTGSGSGVVIKHDGSAIGTASTINFSTNLDVSAISAGIVTITASGGDVVNDTTPQLGGNLDLDGKFINGTGGANITGVVTATTFVGNGDFVNLDVDGETDLDDLSVTGVSTFTGAIDANGNLDVDGQTDLDDVVIAGVSTFTGNIDANGNLDVDGQTDLDDVVIAGVSTFTGSIDANGNLDVDGQTDLDDVVVAGVSTFNDGITLGTNSSTFAAKFADDAVANFGTDNDLQISHDNSNALIRNSTGKIVVVGVVSATSGANITGVVTATTFSGSGASLTNLPSGQLSGALPALDGSALTGVTASGSGIVVKHDGTTVGTAGTVNFSTNLDVTAVSAGIVTITASGGGSGITTENVVADSLVVSGISTFNGALDVNSTSNFGGNVTLSDDIELRFGSSDLQIYHQSGSPGLNHINSSIANLGLNITTNSGNITLQHGTSSKEFIVCDGVTDKNVEIYCNGTKRIETTQSGAKVTGILTATSFSGSLDASNLTGEIASGRFPATLPAASGANLTNLTAGNISGTIAESQIADEAVTFAKMQHVGTGVIIGRNDSGSGDIETLSAADVRTLLNVADGANVGITTFQNAAWTVGNNSSSNYVISGPGGLSGANNPDLHLVRGQTYQFIMNASGHGFGIQTVSGSWSSGNEYTTGITNAQADSGTITFAVPYSAPARLYYACTSNHGGMVGNIYIRGAGGHDDSVGVTTFSGIVNLGSAVNTSSDIDTTNTKLVIKQSASAREDGIYIERPGERKGYYIHMSPNPGAGDALTFARNNNGTKANVLTLDRDGAAEFSGTVTASGAVTATEFVPTLAQLAHRNRIHNGGMVIAQRIGDTETTLTNNNWTQTVDRWKVYENTEAVLTATRVHGSYPTAGTNPSSYSAQRLKVTTADTSIGSSQQCMLAQIIEGFNWQDLRWGTSAAKSVTLSFSVLATGASASNVTGTYCVQCTNASNYDRAYIREYTIDAVDVWKRVTLTFPGDTSGTWDKGTDQACRFAWFLAAGTDHHGSANSWGAFKATTSNQKNFLGNVNNFIFITDVQVEEGTLATPFETKPFTTELQLCQRYYVKDTMTREGGGHGVVTGSLDTIVGIRVDFPVTMRATPNLTLNGTTYRTGGNADAERISSTGFIWGRKQTGSGTFNGAAYATGGYEVSAEY